MWEIGCLNWKNAVDTLKDLPSPAEDGDAVYVREFDSVFVFNQTFWDQLCDGQALRETLDTQPHRVVRANNGRVLSFDSDSE